MSLSSILPRPKTAAILCTLLVLPLAPTERSRAIAAGESADLSITMTADRSRAKIGEYVVYRVTLSNAGPNDATGVRFGIGIGDQLDPRCFVCERTPEAPDGCIVGTLASGASVEGIFVVQVTGTLGNRGGRQAFAHADVSTDTPDPVQSNNRAEVIIDVTGPDKGLIR